MMTCDEIVDLLVDYLDGDLAKERVERLEDHLDHCPRCVEFLDDYRRTGSICRRALAVEMPQQLKSTLVDFLRAEIGSPNDSTG